MLALISTLLIGFAGDPTSGPQAGDELKDFKIKGFSGEKAGKEFQLLADAKKKPTMVFFIQKLSRPAFRLMKAVDAYAGKEEGMNSHFVWVAEDVDKTMEFLKRAEQSLSMKVPIGVCLEGKDGPPAYGLNDQVAVTILIAKDGKVVSNFAFVDPNDTDGPKVVKAVAKALGKKEPDQPEATKQALFPLIRKLAADKDAPEADQKKTLDAIQKLVRANASLKEELRTMVDRAANTGRLSEAIVEKLRKIAE